MPNGPPPPSRTQVEKAGRLLRELLQAVDRGEITSREDPRLWEPEVGAAWRTLVAFRAAHEYPLVKANMGLRSAVKTTASQGAVTQRLKRMTTIASKLIRQPHMSLVRMQDIGGCRAVLASLDDLRRVEAHLLRRRQVIRHRDYIAEPTSFGYRAVHVVVSYTDQQGLDRAIEIQLRTRTQQAWAAAVEDSTSITGIDLKSGIGPDYALEYMALVSEALSHEERGDPLPDDLRRRMDELKVTAIPFLIGTTVSEGAPDRP